MSEDFWDKIQKKAYFKYLNKKSCSMPENSFEDWNEAVKEEPMEDKIAEEAYFHYLKGFDDPLQNWVEAKNEVIDRIRFLAFYLHESNINKSPIENWVEAQKIYIENF